VTREQAITAAKLLDRIAGGSYGERLAEVLVGGHLIDLRRFERPAKSQRARSRR
jgi:hypothetical protein